MTEKVTRLRNTVCGKRMPPEDDWYIELQSSKADNGVVEYDEFDRLRGGLSAQNRMQTPGLSR